MTDTPTPVLFLDLDGTVRHGYEELGHFVNGPEDVVIFPEALHLMRRAKAEGYRIVGISNQGGIALGYLTMGNYILYSLDSAEGVIYNGSHDEYKTGGRLMRYAEITIMVELSEDITSKEREAALMDDINDTLVDSSEFVMSLRSIEIKDITALVESADITALAESADITALVKSAAKVRGE